MEHLVSMLCQMFHMCYLISCPQDSCEVDVLFPICRRRNKSSEKLKSSSATHTVFESGFRPRELDFRVHVLTHSISQKNNYGGHTLILQSK